MPLSSLARCPLFSSREFIILWFYPFVYCQHFYTNMWISQGQEFSTVLFTFVYSVGQRVPAYIVSAHQVLSNEQMLQLQTHTPDYGYNCLVFKNLFNFNWRIIALQYCVRFCHTATWISWRYTYVPSLLNLPPTSHPSRLLQRCYRALVRVLLVIQLIPIGYVERWYWWTYL